jgi:hypothetical protein
MDARAEARPDELRMARPNGEARHVADPNV